jgi:hypothetical protein
MDDTPADDSDTFPHEEFKTLKEQVQQLHQQLGPKQQSPPEQSSPSEIQKLHTAVKELSRSVDHLLEIFQQAAKDMQDETVDPDQLMHPGKETNEALNKMMKHMEAMDKKMQRVLQNNEEIAKGVLVVAEMLQEHNEDKEKLVPPHLQQQAPTFQKPNFSQSNLQSMQQHPTFSPTSPPPPPPWKPTQVSVRSKKSKNQQFPPPRMFQPAGNNDKKEKPENAFI